MVYCAQDTPQVRQEDFSAPGRSRSSATVAGRDGGAGQGFRPAAGEEDGTKEGGLQGLSGKHPQLPIQRKKTGTPDFSRIPGSVEHSGFEPLTPTLPVLCATSCANAPQRNQG